MTRNLFCGVGGGGRGIILGGKGTGRNCPGDNYPGRKLPGGVTPGEGIIDRG